MTATLAEQAAPETCARIWAALPLRSTVLHTRWCGREVNWEVDLPDRPPAENLTTIVNTGSLVYWREWEWLYPASGVQALAIYYGPELLRDHRGPLPVTIFAQVAVEQWPLLAEIGQRVWQEGKEEVWMERMDEPASLARVAEEVERDD